METTIPKPLLFALDDSKKNEVLFVFDKKNNRWYVEFEESAEKNKKVKQTKNNKKIVTKKRGSKK